MITVADYIAKALADHGVRCVFMVTGGGAMFLNDAFGQEKRIQCIFNHHEQACAMAAEGYARVSNQTGVINVTTGPGGINALNGVFGAWVDSIPMLVISGQVKKETCLDFYNLPGLRQIGDQEADVISMAKGITKYAVLVGDPSSIRYHLERALHLAENGRPGPCWLDIPIDVQSSMIDPSRLPRYSSAEDQPNYPLELLPNICRGILDRLQVAERPVIMVGKGVRIAHALQIFDEVIRKLNVPVVTAWTAIDMIDSKDPLFCGRPGDLGDRGGNFTVQNSDVLLVIGTRLGIRQASYNWKYFARCAFKIQVDVDPIEMKKPTVKPDLAVNCDARIFLGELNRQIDVCGFDRGRHTDWLAWCKKRVERYPVVQPHHFDVKGKFINPYNFVDCVFRVLTEEDVVVCSNGTANVVTFQAARIKKGQRVFCNTGNASMGYDLPAAEGAAVASGGKRVICFAGDGSIQLNIQELQTIVHNQWPIKIFVLNNGGYLSIRQTQQHFFGRLIGESPDSGVSFPDMVEVAKTYGIDSIRINRPNFQREIYEIIHGKGPFLCEVMLDPAQEFEPRLRSKRLSDGRIVSPPLEDMYPFLEREELISNLLITPMEGEE